MDLAPLFLNLLFDVSMADWGIEDIDEIPGISLEYWNSCVIRTFVLMVYIRQYVLSILFLRHHRHPRPFPQQR